VVLALHRARDLRKRRANLGRLGSPGKRAASQRGRRSETVPWYRQMSQPMSHSERIRARGEVHEQARLAATKQGRLGLSCRALTSRKAGSGTTAGRCAAKPINRGAPRPAIRLRQYERLVVPLLPWGRRGSRVPGGRDEVSRWRSSASDETPVLVWGLDSRVFKQAGSRASEDAWVGGFFGVRVRFWGLSRGSARRHRGRELASWGLESSGGQTAAFRPGAEPWGRVGPGAGARCGTTVMGPSVVAEARAGEAASGAEG